MKKLLHLVGYLHRCTHWSGLLATGMVQVMLGYETCHQVLWHGDKPSGTNLTSFNFNSILPSSQHFYVIWSEVKVSHTEILGFLKVVNITPINNDMENKVLKYEFVLLAKFEGKVHRKTNVPSTKIWLNTMDGDRECVKDFTRMSRKCQERQRKTSIHEALTRSILNILRKLRTKACQG